METYFWQDAGSLHLRTEAFRDGRRRRHVQGITGPRPESDSGNRTTSIKKDICCVTGDQETCYQGNRRAPDGREGFWRLCQKPGSSLNFSLVRFMAFTALHYEPGRVHLRTLITRWTGILASLWVFFFILFVPWWFLQLLYTYFDDLMGSVATLNKNVELKKNLEVKPFEYIEYDRQVFGSEMNSDIWKNKIK